jgi:hypothetical protein
MMILCVIVLWNLVGGFMCFFHWIYEHNALKKKAWFLVIAECMENQLITERKCQLPKAGMNLSVLLLILFKFVLTISISGCWWWGIKSLDADGCNTDLKEG